ncbi:MAG TPA: hypothetical protein VN702_14635 [Acetobacteraceae bacterium]|nr:hypothetical protein [Acetobacteraceae bacterium]
MATAVSLILEHLRDDGGLQGKDIANIVAVSPAAVSRWPSGKATPDLRTQTVIAELRYVVDRLVDSTRRTKRGLAACETSASEE